MYCKPLRVAVPVVVLMLMPKSVELSDVPKSPCNETVICVEDCTVKERTGIMLRPTMPHFTSTTFTKPVPVMVTGRFGERQVVGEMAVMFGGGSVIVAWVTGAVPVVTTTVPPVLIIPPVPVVVIVPVVVTGGVGVLRKRIVTPASEAVPPEVVTNTEPLMAVGNVGKKATMSESDHIRNDGAETGLVLAPKATVVAPVKPLPIIDITVPLVEGFGETRVITGAGTNTKPSREAVPTGVVTNTLPVAPRPTIAIITESETTI